jgi:hypothetical protein
MSEAFAALLAGQTNKRSDTPWHSIWVFGDPGTRKTRFALGCGRLGPVAYIGTESGAEDYRNDPEFAPHGYDELEVRDLKTYRAAVAAVAASSKYQAVVIDTMTDIYAMELAEATKVKGDGSKYVPIQAWGVMREGHKAALRTLRDAPMHKIYISQQKEIVANVQKPDGTTSIETVGFKIDSEKKDGYAVKVVMRMSRRGGKFIGEVLKDRVLGSEPGLVVEEPRVEHWLRGK